MGNNAAFSAFEDTVLAVYKHSVLTKPLLKDLMEVYRDMDIDSGGMSGTLSKDGLDIVDLVIKTWGLKPPVQPDLPKDYKKWTAAQADLNEQWQEKRWQLFNKITGKAGWC